jgi:hypothetical protein
MPAQKPAAAHGCVGSPEQAREHLGFGRRQTKGGSQCVGTILGVGWRTDEHHRNGYGLQPRTEVAAGEWQDVSEDNLRHEWRVSCA